MAIFQEDRIRVFGPVVWLSIDLGFRCGGPAGILKANGANQKARQISTGVLVLVRLSEYPRRYWVNGIGTRGICCGSGIPPQVRGVNICRAKCLYPVLGIPPQVRGEQIASGDVPHLFRNTPVLTGRAVVVRRSESAIKEYPRTYGASQLNSANGNQHPGIPPLTWGKHRSTTASTASCGYIPTYVGQTKA